MYHNFCVYDTHFLKLIQNLITTGKQFEELAWNIAYLWFDVNLVNGYETLILNDKGFQLKQKTIIFVL